MLRVEFVSSKELCYVTVYLCYMILVLRVIFVSRYLLYGMLLCMLYNVSVLWDIWFLEVMLLSYGLQIKEKHELAFTNITNKIQASGLNTDPYGFHCRMDPDNFFIWLPRSGSLFVVPPGSGST